MVPGQQGQHFVPTPSQPYHLFGHVPPNVGMPGVQTQPPQYSQQLFPVRPGQPGHITSSSQVPYTQTNKILTSGSTQPQPNAPTVTGFGPPGPPFSSSYTVRLLPLCLFFLLWMTFYISFVFTFLDSCSCSLYHHLMVSNNHHPWSNQLHRCMQPASLQQQTLGLFL